MSISLSNDCRASDNDRLPPVCLSQCHSIPATAEAAGVRRTGFYYYSIPAFCCTAADTLLSFFLSFLVPRAVGSAAADAIRLQLL